VVNFIGVNSARQVVTARLERAQTGSSRRHDGVVDRSSVGLATEERGRREGNIRGEWLCLDGGEGRFREQRTRAW